MDDLIEKAMQNGAIAAKICGAGGGGCIAFFCEENRRPDVERALAEEEEGTQVLDWKLCTEGLSVRES
jgi:D-glycero-alpha-D-manno-heptose-7-phosphate kinase